MVASKDCRASESAPEILLLDELMSLCYVLQRERSGIHQRSEFPGFYQTRRLAQYFTMVLTTLSCEKREQGEYTRVGRGFER
jgi:hypothetical protein